MQFKRSANRLNQKRAAGSAALEARTRRASSCLTAKGAGLRQGRRTGARSHHADNGCARHNLGRASVRKTGDTLRSGEFRLRLQAAHVEIPLNQRGLWMRARTGATAFTFRYARRSGRRFRYAAALRLALRAATTLALAATRGFRFGLRVRGGRAGAGGCNRGADDQDDRQRHDADAMQTSAIHTTDRIHDSAVLVKCPAVNCLYCCVRKSMQWQA